MCRASPLGVENETQIPFGDDKQILKELLQLLFDQGFRHEERLVNDGDPEHSLCVDPVGLDAHFFDGAFVADELDSLLCSDLRGLGLELLRGEGDLDQCGLAFWIGIGVRFKQSICEGLSFRRLAKASGEMQLQ